MPLWATTDASRHQPGIRKHSGKRKAAGAPGDRTASVTVSLQGYSVSTVSWTWRPATLVLATMLTESKFMLPIYLIQLNLSTEEMIKQTKRLVSCIYI